MKQTSVNGREKAVHVECKTPAACHATVGNGKSPSFCISCGWCWETQAYVKRGFGLIPKELTEKNNNNDCNS